MNKLFQVFFLIILIVSSGNLQAQTAQQIIDKADHNMRGTTSYAEITITVVRPSWSKEMTMKSWTFGDDYAVSVVVAPAKEKGTVFLKRKNEVWSYTPVINRTIKLPPSMMLQSWMGTDLTNDDMVKQSSMVKDYTQKILGAEKVGGYDCWKIELIPHEDAPVVWGKIIIWIEKKDYMEMKVSFYDEDNFLVNKLIASDVRTFGDRKLPAKMEFIPVEEKGKKTIIQYNDWKFDIPIEDVFFTTANMKKIK